MQLFFRSMLTGILIICASVWGFERFSNFASAITVSDLLVEGDTVWAATSGGLVKYNRRTQAVQQFSDVRDFPDLYCTALHRDRSGVFWVGTKQGYLYRRERNGRNTIYNLYAKAKPNPWAITQIVSYEKFLIIGSSEGCSFFNPARQTAQNATQFGTLNNTLVRTVAIHRDTLFVGLDEGYVKTALDKGRIASINPYDRTIWQSANTDTAVVSFIWINDTLHTFPQPTVRYGNHIAFEGSWRDSNQIERSVLFVDSMVAATTKSRITAMDIDADGTLWIGTTENYFWALKDSLYRQVTLSGITAPSVNKIFVSSSGEVWCLPALVLPPYPDWVQISVYNDRSWNYYNPTTTPFIGSFGENHDFRGISQDRFGNIWLGTSGGNIKRRDAGTFDWNQYDIGNKESSTGFKFRPWKSRDKIVWGKCDAIAQDSSGYLWFGLFEGHAGSLLCYDPAFLHADSGSWKRFFPLDSPNYVTLPYAINVDPAGRIFWGSEDGLLFMMSHRGDPLRDSVTIERLPGNYLKIIDMASSPNGVTWIATADGLLYYDKSEGLRVVIDFPKNISCIEAESDTVLWIGTTENGLIRYVPYGDTMQPTEITYYDQDDGLVSNAVNDLHIDRKRGALWVATAAGLSRYELGHTFSVRTDNKSILACPNPFSLSRHPEVSIYKVAPYSEVSIFDVRGQQVCRLTAERRNVSGSEFEWVVTWRPAANVVPGTYFFSASSNEGRSSFLPASGIGKLLVLP